MIKRKRRKKKGADASNYATFRYQVDKLSQVNKGLLGPKPYGHTLNHKIPIRKAYLMKMSAEETGSFHNLEWTPAQKNLQDGSRITKGSIEAMRALGRDDLAEMWEYKLSTRR